MARIPLAAIAARLITKTEKVESFKLVYIARGECRAAELLALLKAMSFDGEAIAFPAWDCLPYDRSSPTAETMGLRMKALRQISEARSARPVIIVATPEAILQRLPPQENSCDAITLKVGDPIEPEVLKDRLARMGYKSDDLVDEPGEIAFRGQVAELFPAGSSRPFRVDIEDARIEAIRTFDRATQRSIDDVCEFTLDPASEVVDVPADERFLGMEHWLPAYYETLPTFFDYTKNFEFYVEPNSDKRVTSVLTAIEEGYRDRLRWHGSEEEQTRQLLDIEKLYLSREEWDTGIGRNPFDLDLSGLGAVADFASMQSPKKALNCFLKNHFEREFQLILAAGAKSDLGKLARLATRQTGLDTVAISSLQDALALKSKSIATLALHASAGFIDDQTGIVLIAAADLFGSRTRVDGEKQRSSSVLMFDDAFTLNDVVIHMDHGIGILRNVETLQSDVIGVQDTLRLEYAKSAVLLASVNEAGKIWRYGSNAEAVKLDRLKGTAWGKRKQKVEMQIAETARDLIELADKRRNATAEKIAPSRVEYERFVDRFPFTLTPDQAQALEDVADDLNSGKPMDRLIVGDVGFGKTEVALRAAAAVALAGKQVAFAAPTTVLVRQHLESFKRRFAGMDIEIAQLSRLVSKKEADDVKRGLSDGRIAIVIGTQALAAKDVAFHNLGLVIIDEEQRFGAAYKQQLRALAPSCHVLTLTATPIPRTLQAARVGLQDLSVIATPPAKRRSIRTFAMHPDMATIRSALMREKRRGGQSFIVVPRIEDIEAVATDIKTAVPELKALIAHGKLPALKVDDTMIRFARGASDILIATNIIETGLDVPNANTIVIWNAELFGLSQLHQLRGRVGRSRAQGICYLLTEKNLEEDASVAKRLSTLAALDRLGSGMAISMRDYDARGAGDLTGEAQAGHIKLIGSSLYQHLLSVALDKSLGKHGGDWEPELNLELDATLPSGYIPEPELRINLISRMARVQTQEEIERLEDELEDRFGELPEAVQTLLAIAQLKLLCRDHGVARVEAGPQAIAFYLRDQGVEDNGLAAASANWPNLEWNGERLILREAIADPHQRLLRAKEALDI